MALECPNCREPVSFFRAIRTTAWGRFRCKACGSILGISLKRRLLALIPWAAVIFLLMRVVHIQKYGILAFAVVLAGVFVAIFYFLEDVVLVERRAFCCKKCGYDLQGQVEKRCPECGEPFDAAEKARILARAGMPPPKARHRWVMVVLFLLLFATLIANYITYRSAGRRPAPPQPTSAPP
jgi:hypothetical protein